MTEQVDKPAEAVGQEPPKTKACGRRGRPPGRKNRDRREVALSPSLRFIQEHMKRLLEQIGDAFKVVYFLFDGELGHNDAMQMVRQVGLHLISKLRYNSALSFPYDGPYCGRGPRRQYGQKVDYQHIPSAYLQSTSIEKEIKTQIYQMSLWHFTTGQIFNSF
jgi:putative transposase